MFLELLTRALNAKLERFEKLLKKSRWVQIETFFIASGSNVYFQKEKNHDFTLVQLFVYAWVV